MTPRLRSGRAPLRSPSARSYGVAQQGFAGRGHKKIRNRETPQRTRESRLYRFNTELPFANELRNLVLKLSPPPFPHIEKELKKIGRLKLAVLSGVFLSLENSRVDVLVVGDDIDFKKFNNFIKQLETQFGAELRYVVLGAEEFLYRYDMMDRFVFDILESPHKKLINRLGLS